MTSYTVEVRERYQFTIDADSREAARELVAREVCNINEACDYEDQHSASYSLSIEAEEAEE